MLSNKCKFTPSVSEQFQHFVHFSPQFFDFACDVLESCEERFGNDVKAVSPAYLLLKL